MDFKYIKSVEYLIHLYFVALNKAVYNVRVTAKMYNVSHLSTGISHSHHSSRPCTGRSTWSDTRERLTFVQLYWTWPGTSTSCWMSSLF